MQDPNQFATNVYEKLNETTQLLKTLIEVMNKSSNNIIKFNSLIEEKIVVLSQDIKGLNEYLKTEDTKYNENLKSTASRLSEQIKTLSDYFNLKNLTDSISNIKSELRTLDKIEFDKDNINDAIKNILNYAKKVSGK